ncbi:MAG: 5-methylthioadenosine/S-adenosylhomocysteine deaminase, partial [Acidobacteriota bacterium]|nr:5-methylthioadenosine/S-adenosylhomocysteine deaminase [Acidobacteriota bacterium]
MLLIRDCRILSESGRPEAMDIRISQDRIDRIGTGLSEDDCEVLDADGALAIPGLVNAHLHSSEVLLRGSYDLLPFDAWGLYVYPHFRPGPLPERLIYLRTALVAIESLRSGVTCVVDDVAD